MRTVSPRRGALSIDSDSDPDPDFDFDHDLTDRQPLVHVHVLAASSCK
ncbi:MAG: hypothetical protein ACOX52_04530 [Verrucomicrobiota bacterium]